VQLCVYGLWSIWWARNDFVFNPRGLDPRFVADRARYGYAEFLSTMEGKASRALPVVKWSGIQGAVKINCDVAADHAKGRVGVGCVAR